MHRYKKTRLIHCQSSQDNHHRHHHQLPTLVIRHLAQSLPRILRVTGVVSCPVVSCCVVSVISRGEQWWPQMSTGEQWWAGVSSDEQWSVLVFMSLVSSDKQGWAVVTTDCHRWARVSRGDRVTGGEHEQQVWAVNREHELGALRTIGWWITFMHAMYLMPYACTCEKQSRCAYKCTHTYLYTTCTCICICTLHGQNWQTCSSSFRVVIAFSTWGFNDP